MGSSPDISLLVGGQQGEGLESIGEMVSQGLGRLGYFTYSFRTFSSRIKGGHTHVKIRIGNDAVYTNLERVDLIVAFDQDTISLNQNELTDGSVILLQEGLALPVVDNNTDTQRVAVQSIDFRTLATQAGATITKNLVALGAICAVLDLPLEHFDSMIDERFGKKGETVVAQNRQALRDGYQACTLSRRFSLGNRAVAPSVKPMILSGNEAIALGAVAAGCKFMAGYPITPASEVLENLVHMLPKVGGVVVQTEDELAAINVALGAAYSGVRAMTATSGPGLSLMQETIGLAGMTETPVVIVDLQRGGPSSGMATKHEQSDLFAMLHGTHGEVPRIVMAPSTVEDAFYDTLRAFNYAERYQCPVFVAADLALATCRQTVQEFDLNAIPIERGNIASPEVLAARETSAFDRYAVTQEGISVRTLPGQKNGLHHTTGIEHSSTGYPSEDPANRVQMMNKRSQKIRTAPFAESERVKFEGDADSELLLVGFGSTYGAIREARLDLEAQGIRASHMQIRIISPFPTQVFETRSRPVRKIVVVENNSMGQLAQLIKSEVPCHERLTSLCKYNGKPFEKSEITEFCKEAMQHVHHS
ncbi:2-oxoacid:acceptor oxidoreductase subunit alpha [Alicyclobacillus tolerans]|uniref:2-oxoacid:acceptor oxidoreductase subunit alpha n=1 Tax=Alicyclobacillus tolerans TaxID=90970 RepID=UPI001F2CC3C0|nr:2-oxoacid:acceptor oxidoreductase subunit alpha [Alicyclobacillus tolerans]MCF8567454.1 2-oxoacid:acceptor oxidoreductase subunit alpha [Alicyclobacillus tolerans]